MSTTALGVPTGNIGPEDKASAGQTPLAQALAAAADTSSIDMDYKTLHIGASICASWMRRDCFAVVVDGPESLTLRWPDPDDPTHSKLLSETLGPDPPGFTARTRFHGGKLKAGTRGAGSKPSG